MSGPTSRVRLIAWFAIALLILDGVLLLGAGVVGGSLGALVGGAACLAGAWLVSGLSRTHQRRIAELREARREVHEEVRALQSLIKRPGP